jgi:F-type H+-transporting ATPase subunit b
MRQERLAALNRENQGLNREISRLVQDEVMALTRKTLRDLAGTTLEDVVCDAFLRRIGDQDSETKAKLALTVQTSSEPAQVRSAFPLTAAQQDAIRHALNSLVAAEMLCRFEVAPELIGGIELLVNGQKLAWSIGNYLDTLEKSVAELISKQSGAQIKPEAESAGDEESK